MKKITALIISLIAINSVQAASVYNCAYVADNRIIKVEIHITPNDDYFFWQDHRYTITDFEDFANLQIAFSAPYKAIDGSINQVGVGVENHKRYLLVRDYNTKQFVIINDLSCKN